MTERCVLRFAPSPNGFLHLGHAFSALFTARAARALGGAFILRIEDIDRERSKPEFVAGVFADLAWLGLSWPKPAWRQSGRGEAYRAAAAELSKGGLLYPCFCSRAEVAAAAVAMDPDGASLYTGTCRGLEASEAAQRVQRGEPVQWRLKMDACVALAGPLSIQEAPAKGTDADWRAAVTRAAAPEQWGDAVIVRKESSTSYHLGVVVDDAAQGVTHVTRGMDLFHATSLHVLVQRLLGLPSPLYCHHGLLLDGAGQKLSKSRGSQSLARLREAGWTASDVRNQLGFS